MLIDGKLVGESISEIIRSARELEDSGYDGVWTSESIHDPFLPHVLAAEHTSVVTLGTSIAVAFARNPMELAYTAYDLNSMSQGRFVLGLGSQVKAHIERRFSMPWSQPAARMNEFVRAMRAIWRSWDTGEPLEFEGEFYRHTLMTPFFTPPANGLGEPRIFLAAVGTAMTQTAGEVADGIFLHGFTTTEYLKQVTLPALNRGLDLAHRDRGGFQVAHMPFVVTGRTADDMERAADGVRKQIAFYASTPSYLGVLELHGWASLGAELHQLSRSDLPDKWTRMGEAIDDEVLNAFAVVARPADLPAALLERWDGLVDRISFYTPYDRDEELFTEVLRLIKTTERRAAIADAENAG